MHRNYLIPKAGSAPGWVKYLNLTSIAMPMAKPKEEKEMSKDEQIGFHKGSLATLAKERQELARILGIVEQLM